MSTSTGRPRPFLAGVFRTACKNCVRSKRGCGGGNPCEQCLKRNIPCAYAQRRMSGPRGRVSNRYRCIRAKARQQGGVEAFERTENDMVEAEDTRNQPLEHWQQQQVLPLSSEKSPPSPVGRSLSALARYDESLSSSTSGYAECPPPTNGGRDSDSSGFRHASPRWASFSAAADSSTSTTAGSAQQTRNAEPAAEYANGSSFLHRGQSQQQQQQEDYHWHQRASRRISVSSSSLSPVHVNAPYGSNIDGAKDRLNGGRPAMALVQGGMAFSFPAAAHRQARDPWTELPSSPLSLLLPTPQRLRAAAAAAPSGLLSSRRAPPSVPPPLSLTRPRVEPTAGEAAGVAVVAVEPPPTALRSTGLLFRDAPLSSPLSEGLGGVLLSSSPMDASTSAPRRQVMKSPSPLPSSEGLDGVLRSSSAMDASTSAPRRQVLKSPSPLPSSEGLGGVLRSSSAMDASTPAPRRRVMKSPSPLPRAVPTHAQSPVGLNEKRGYVAFLEGGPVGRGTENQPRGVAGSAPAAGSTMVSSPQRPDGVLKLRHQQANRDSLNASSSLAAVLIDSLRDGEDEQHGQSASLATSHALETVHGHTRQAPPWSPSISIPSRATSDLHRRASTARSPFLQQESPKQPRQQLLPVPAESRASAAAGASASAIVSSFPMTTTPSRLAVHMQTRSSSPSCSSKSSFGASSEQFPPPRSALPAVSIFADSQARSTRGAAPVQDFGPASRGLQRCVSFPQRGLRAGSKSKLQASFVSEVAAGAPCASWQHQQQHRHQQLAQPLETLLSRLEEEPIPRGDGSSTGTGGWKGYGGGGGTGFPPASVAQQKRPPAAVVPRHHVPLPPSSGPSDSAPYSQGVELVFPSSSSSTSCSSSSPSPSFSASVPSSVTAAVAATEDVVSGSSMSDSVTGASHLTCRPRPASSSLYSSKNLGSVVSDSVVASAGASAVPGSAPVPATPAQSHGPVASGSDLWEELVDLDCAIMANTNTTSMSHEEPLMWPMEAVGANVINDASGGSSTYGTAAFAGVW